MGHMAGKLTKYVDELPVEHLFPSKPHGDFKVHLPLIELTWIKQGNSNDWSGKLDLDFAATKRQPKGDRTKLTLVKATIV